MESAIIHLKSRLISASDKNDSDSSYHLRGRLVVMEGDDRRVDDDVISIDGHPHRVTG